jgi:3',5'-cyclic AMP phosphodiesterase CpdA
VWGQALQQALLKGPPDFILFSGDSCLLGVDQSEWDAWWMAEDPVLASIPMIAAHGNHDVNSVNFFSQMALPGDEQNYDLDLGPVHLSVANDTPLDVSAVMGMNATLLSQHVMEGVGAPWNLVMHHKPVFSASAGPHPEDQLPQQNYWSPIYDMYHVDMVFNGHDHDYERTKPMNNKMPVTSPANGTVYVVVGSAGAELYDNGTSFWTAYSEKTYAFSMLTVRQGMLKLDAYRPTDGSAIESFTIMK